MRRKTPTMKKWGIVSWIVTITLSLFFVVACFFPCDTASLAIVVSCAWADTAVYTGCYAYKEKAENKMKIACQSIERLCDRYDINAVAPIIQSMLTG